MYVPPERILSSFSYSAFAAACFSASVSGFAGSTSSLCRISSCLALSRARARSTSRGNGPFGGGDLEIERLRSGGASRRGEGDRDVGERFRDISMGGSPGSGVGRRTADCITAAILAWTTLDGCNLYQPARA